MSFFVFNIKEHVPIVSLHLKLFLIFDFNSNQLQKIKVMGWFGISRQMRQRKMTDYLQHCHLVVTDILFMKHAAALR